jgi:protein ImuB
VAPDGTVRDVSRFASLVVERFAAAAHARCEPALRDAPLAVVTGTVPARRVVDASRAARADGVVPGITETEARARSTALAVRPVSAERMQLAQHALLEVALGVSPRVEDGGAGVVHVDLAGLARLLGDDHRIAERLVRAAAAVGLEAAVGVAGTRAAACIAARTVGGVVFPRGAETAAGSRWCVVPPGRDREVLAGVPLTVLELRAPLVETFARWGLATLGDLAALARDGLAARVGRAGLEAQDEALGRDLAPFRPWQPPPFWQEAQGLDWEIDSWGGLEPVLRQLLERLTARLAAARVSADTLALELALATGGHDERAVALASPSCDPRPMLVLAALELEARPPAAAITRVAVSAHPVRLEAAQARFGERPGPAPRDLAETLARLARLVGRDSLGSPVVLDSHRADPVVLAPFVPPPAGERDADAMLAEDTPEAACAALAFRRVRPPRRVDVALVDDALAHVRFHDALGGVSAPQPVVASAGPWRTSGEWWTAEGWAREEWDVALADGMLCRLARDRRTGAWFLEGAYD